jgi:hypothetical protein
VLGDIIQNRLDNPLLPNIFPGYIVNPIGLAVPRQTN